MNSSPPHHIFLKYYWPDRDLAIGGTSCSAARIISSYSESVREAETVREATSVSASLEKAHTTLQENVLALPLELLFVITVYCWFWTMSGWTHIIFSRGVGTRTRLFSSLLWISILITFSFLFEMGTTPSGTDEWSLVNWKDVILAVTFFCSGRSLSTSALIRAWRTSLKM